MKEIITTNPFFGISISIIAYAIGTFLNKKTKLAIVNPLLISYILIISTLLIFDIPLSAYNEGGNIINMFLSPATAVLSLTIYRQWDIVKKNIAAILTGTIVGSLTSILVIMFLCKLFGLDNTVTSSLLPKSITTPMAIAVSETLGGIPSLTVLAVIITGILGNILAPILIKLFRIKDPVVQGVAIGTASHAVGTSKAIEIGEVQGALSGVALTFSGLITVVISLLLPL